MATLGALYDENLEPELVAWLNRYADPVAALRDISSLFANLKESRIEGDVDASVSITGPVHVGRGTKIHAHVVIDGPVIIGENVSIRSHSQIRNYAYIGSDCVVGHGADIKKSLCLNGAKIQDGTFTGDSVIGMYGRIGSGAILSNRKFNQTEVKYKNDAGEIVGAGMEFLGSVIGKHSRIGANAVLSPGTLIGQHTWVASGCVVHGRYGDDLMITPPPMELRVQKKDRVSLRSGTGEYEHL